MYLRVSGLSLRPKSKNRSSACQSESVTRRLAPPPRLGPQWAGRTLTRLPPTLGQFRSVEIQARRVCGLRDALLPSATWTMEWPPGFFAPPSFHVLCLPPFLTFSIGLYRSETSFCFLLASGLIALGLAWDGVRMRLTLIIPPMPQPGLAAKARPIESPSLDRHCLSSPVSPAIDVRAAGFPGYLSVAACRMPQRGILGFCRSA